VHVPFAWPHLFHHALNVEQAGLPVVRFHRTDSPQLAQRSGNGGESGQVTFSCEFCHAQALLFEAAAFATTTFFLAIRRCFSRKRFNGPLVLPERTMCSQAKLVLHRNGTPPMKAFWGLPGHGVFWMAESVHSSGKCVCTRTLISVQYLVSLGITVSGVLSHRPHLRHPAIGASPFFYTSTLSDRLIHSRCNSRKGRRFGCITDLLIFDPQEPRSSSQRRDRRPRAHSKDTGCG
jgi:hypothetical protein